MKLRHLFLGFGWILLAGCGGGGDGGAIASGPLVTGAFVDSVVVGVDYKTSSGEYGTTNAAGELSYRDGDTVTFSIGNLILGSCFGQPLITPADLTSSSAAELNLARFLQTLDDDGDPTNGIVIVPALAALIDAELAGGASIDFSLDSTSFATNSDLADLLLAIDAVTAADSTTLVSAAAARAHLDATLAGVFGPAPYRIDVRGGSGSQAGADNTGGVHLGIPAGSGTIEVRSSGSVDASFVPIAASDPDLGPLPIYITQDTTINHYDNLVDTPPPAGTLYKRAEGTIETGALFVSDGDNDFLNDPKVTGLSISAGATLTINHVFGPYNFGSIRVDYGLINRGTISGIDVNSFDRQGIFLVTTNLINLGTIDTHGRLPGQNGGYVSLCSIGGVLTNQGSILTYGADNRDSNAGDGGEIGLVGDRDRTENTALLDSHGGTASGDVGLGGQGGAIDIRVVHTFYNSGPIRAFGGDGGSGGGEGGTIYISNANSSGIANGLRNSGSLDSSGGAGKNGPGGSGGTITIYNRSDTLSSGDILTAGGDSADAYGSSLPGAGGSLILEQRPELVACHIPAGDALISGNMDLSGGNAINGNEASAGDAGTVTISIDNSTEGGAQKISLLGYGQIVADGGSGQNSGGQGGVVRLANSGVGPVINEAQISARGGDADTAHIGSQGGAGGVVNLYSAGTGSATLITPDVSGGTGANSGADGTLSIDQSPLIGL